MLIRFGVENHLSIKDYQEISFVASKVHDDLPHTIHKDLKSIKEKEFLPVIALYGANASGKSNMLDALSSFRHSIVRSYIEWEDRRSLPHRPFVFEDTSRQTESVYDCDVLINDVRYSYGFALNKERVLREWLFSYPKGARNIVFQRDLSDDTDSNEPGYFGSSFKGINDTWRAISKNPKTLLISASGKLENHHDQLTPIYTYFRDAFKITELRSDRVQTFLAQDIKENKIEQKLANILAEADFGIVGIQVNVEEIDEREKKFRSGIVKLVSEMSNTPEMADQLEDSLSYTLTFLHRCAGGEIYPLDFGSESTGTKYLLGLLVPVISALENGSILIVDEITTNLHTKLSEVIVKLFTSPETNKTDAQFVFSTHDTNLLSRELLRRDEIWFTEKNELGATHIYPLTDFKTRKADNIEKGYLQGRFGAIPFPYDIAALMR